ncbi:hypothetical protein [Xanthobacter sp.]|uniref:hypothetical protein n=1 Tax=Xanthobacter sp. TaxID=35809 RepID=UPI0035ADF2F8
MAGAAGRGASVPVSPIEIVASALKPAPENSRLTVLLLRRTVFTVVEQGRSSRRRQHDLWISGKAARSEVLTGFFALAIIFVGLESLAPRVPPLRGPLVAAAGADQPRLAIRLGSQAWQREASA